MHIIRSAPKSISCRSPGRYLWLRGSSRLRRLLLVEAAVGQNFSAWTFSVVTASPSVSPKRWKLIKSRAALSGVGVNDAEVQYQKNEASAASRHCALRPLPTPAPKVEQALESQFPQSQFKPLEVQQVGAVVGEEIRKSAVIASMLAMFGILVYVAFRYEFSSLPSPQLQLYCTIFLFTIGCYCLASLLFHRQFNATVVAALLTIIGFSINDKVVIFDRIRENLKLGARGTFKEIINQALNQTLSRTIITSGTVFLATLALYIWGGAGNINDFAFYFPDWHHRWHLFLHLHRQRDRADVAQRPAPEHRWWIASDHAKRCRGKV